MSQQNLPGMIESFLRVGSTFDFGEFTIQGLSVDAKGMRGLIFIAAGFFENFFDVFFFKLM